MPWHGDNSSKPQKDGAVYADLVVGDAAELFPDGALTNYAYIR